MEARGAGLKTETKGGVSNAIVHLVDTPVVFALRRNAAIFAHCLMRKIE